MNGRPAGAIGYAILAAGLAAVFLSAAMTGTLSNTGDSEDTQGYDGARLAVLLGLLWIAVASVLWRAGQIKLLVSAMGLAVLGFALGAFVPGDLDTGGSTDSKLDVGFVIGSAGALVGLFVSWGGRRLLRLKADGP